MTSPYIKILKLEDIGYPIVESASVKRPFLDETYNKIGYNCGPLTLANQHGWWFLLPQDVVVEWDGKSKGIDGEDMNHVQVLEGQYYSGYRIASNESGVGQISFFFNCNIETDPEHYLIFSGPPNYFHPDAKPLEVIWRSDFFNYHEISFNWVITTPNKRVVFPKGMPVLFIKNYPKDLLNSTDVLIDQLNNYPAIVENTNQYAIDRVKWFREHDRYDFRKFYRAAVGPRGKKMLPDSPLKMNLKKPRHN